MPMPSSSCQIAKSLAPSKLKSSNCMWSSFSASKSIVRDSLCVSLLTAMFSLEPSRTSVASTPWVGLNVAISASDGIVHSRPSSDNAKVLKCMYSPYSHLHPDSGEESMPVLIPKLYTLPLDCFV
ncbi:hypothetical protein EMIT0P395_20301 [Pseudomonas sp. IT-P395]